MVKLVQTEPLRYVTDNNVTQYGEYHAGGDAAEYLRDLSGTSTTTAGLPGIATTTFTNDFHESNHVSSRYSYASASMLIRQKHMRFDASVSLIKSTYLTSLFKSDIIDLTAQQLVTKYGTHVLTDIILGAKLNVYYRSQNSSSNRGYGAKAGASVTGLAKVFNFSTNESNTFKDSTIQSNYDQHIYYNTVGGDGTKGIFGDLTLDNTAPKISIANWQSSCTRENAAFIQLGSTDGSLILLSDLIDDPIKKQAVKAYIDQYIASKAIVLTNTYASVKSNSFSNVFLRLDGKNYDYNAPAGSSGGIVNAQFSSGPWEKMLFTKQTDGSYTIESYFFPGLYLRMDGRNVPTSPLGISGGIVNLAYGAGLWEKFKIIKQPDGTYTIESINFPSTFLRIDGTGVTSLGNGNGGGVVNCSKPTPGIWEKFVITPALN